MNKSTLLAITILLSAALLIAGCGKDQQAGTTPSILECIPAGSLYYMTNSISKTIDSTEMFLIDIGVGKMLGIGVSRPGDGRQRDSVLMTKLKEALHLGEGFDPNGAAAFVMVNPETAGVDLLKGVKPNEVKATSSNVSVDYAGTDKLQKLIAFVAPGMLETFFIGDKPSREGRLTILTRDGKKMYASQKGSYVVFSPTKTAVEAILDAKKTAAAELSADEIAMIKGSELGIHYSIGPYRPLLEKMLDGLTKEIEKNLDKPTAAGFGVYVTMMRALSEQIDAMTLGVKLGQNGVNIDSISTAKPGSAASKIFQAESTVAGGAKVLDSLPSLPYVAAMGMEGWFDNPDLYGAMMDLSKALIGPDSIYKVDEKTRTRMLELQNEAAGMITGAQIVIGAAPKGKGMVNLSYVIKCKDSAKYRSVFPESIEISNKMLANMDMPPEAPKISMTYTKDAEKVGGLSVDAMNIVLSDLPGVGKEELPAVLKMFLGEENIRMLIATPDAKTLVMTLGGSKEALIEALKVAGGSGPIPAEPGTVLAMKRLPENPSIVALLSVSNLMDVIRAGAKAAGAPPESVEMIPVIKCKTPIAFGARAKGPTLHTGLFVAKPLIKDAVGAVMAAIARAQAAKAKWRRQVTGGDTRPAGIDPSEL